MSTISSSPTGIATPAGRAAELIKSLPQDADAAGRVAAARAATERLEAEFPGTPEADTLKLTRAMADATKRGVTRESLLNTGLDLCARGAVAGSSYLAGAALQMADLGWDEQDKWDLTGAGYRHLRPVLPQAGEVLKLAEKHGTLAHRKLILQDTEAGAKDLPGLASGLVKAQTKPQNWQALCDGLMAHLAESGPPELRSAYGLGRTMIGTGWFGRLSDRNSIYLSFLEDPLRSADQATARAAQAVLPTEYYYGNPDRVTAAQRAMDALEPQASDADRSTLRMARALGETSGNGRDNTPRTQKILSEGLKRLGRVGPVDGPFLADNARALVEVAGKDREVKSLLPVALEQAAEQAPNGRWKAAFNDLARLIPIMNDSYYTDRPIEGFLKATQALAALGPDADPVEVMVKGVSGISQDGDPSTVLEDFLGGRETGHLKNSPLVRELLAVLAEDGPTPTLRATARFVHRSMESGNLKDGVKSLRDAFEISQMARAVSGETANPNAIKISDESVQIGGVLITRKQGAPATA